MTNTTEMTSTFNTPLPAGSTVYISGGTYVGDFRQWGNGVSSSYVVFKPVEGERVIIDGSLYIQGNYTQWEDIEIYDSEMTNRESEEETPSPTDISPRYCVEDLGIATRLYNCILHDAKDGIVSATPASGGEYYGNLVFNCGWKVDGHSWGHGIYVPNYGEKTITIKHNLSLNHFGYGIHLYSGTGKVNNYSIISNVVWEAGVHDAIYRTNLLINGDVYPIHDFVIQGNYLYHASALAGGRGCDLHGYGDPLPLISDVIINTSNIFIDGAVALQLSNVSGVVENNTIIGGLDGFVQEDHPTNTYSGAINIVVVIPNEKKITRANVIVINHSGADTIVADLTAVTGLIVGNDVTVRNAEDYFNDVQTLTLDENKQIIINIQAVNRTVVAPFGWTSSATTLPTFGCFVVEKA